MRCLLLTMEMQSLLRDFKRFVREQLLEDRPACFIVRRTDDHLVLHVYCGLARTISASLQHSP